MSLNRKVRKQLVATLATVSTVTLLMATATTAPAKAERMLDRLGSRVAEEGAPPRRPAPTVPRQESDRPRPVAIRSDQDRPVPTAPDQSAPNRPPVPHR